MATGRCVVDGCSRSHAVLMVFLFTLLCGSFSEISPCYKFTVEIVSKREDSILPRLDIRPSIYLELLLENCYLKNDVPEKLSLNDSIIIDYVTLMLVNVTISSTVHWDNILPFKPNGTIEMKRCKFEDETVLNHLPVAFVSELNVIRSGLRQLPDFSLAQGCSMKKANFSQNSITKVAHTAFNNIFLNCSFLSDIDMTYNRIKYFPAVAERGQNVGKCRLHLEHNPLSCKSNDHLVLKQRTREMLMHTPHCDNNGTLVQFWFHDIKLCDICACTIRYDVYVDCSRRNLKKLPSELPRETTHLNVSGNEIKSLLTPEQMGGYRTVKHLDASWNYIERVDDYGPHICSLVMLDLSHNRLRNFPGPLVQQLIDILNCRPLLTMGKMLLAHNPWTCDCDLRPFKRFLGAKAREIVDFSRVRCESDGEPVWSVDEDQLCPPPLYKFNFWDLAICVMLVLITVIISKTVTDHYRQKQTGKLPKFFQM